MNFIQVLVDFKRHLQIFQLLRNKPTADEVGDEQRQQQGRQRVEGHVRRGGHGGGGYRGESNQRQRRSDEPRTELAHAGGFG